MTDCHDNLFLGHDTGEAVVKHRRSCGPGRLAFNLGDDRLDQPSIMTDQTTGVVRHQSLIDVNFITY